MFFVYITISAYHPPIQISSYNYPFIPLIDTLNIESSAIRFYSVCNAKIKILKGTMFLTRVTYVTEVKAIIREKIKYVNNFLHMK